MLKYVPSNGKWHRSETSAIDKIATLIQIKPIKSKRSITTWCQKNSQMGRQEAQQNDGERSKSDNNSRKWLNNVYK